MLVKVNAEDGLNIRRHPSVTSEIIGVLPYGTIVEGEPQGKWLTYGRGNLYLDYLLQLEDTSLIEFAESINVDWKLLQAIFKAESQYGSFKDGKLVIRFEAHIFVTKHPVSVSLFQWNKRLPWQNQKVFINHQWEDIHTSQQQENRVFEFAQSINRDAAFNSISMGEAQIMGFNHKSVGFRTAEHMYRYASVSKENDRQLYYRYIKTRVDLIQALRNKNFNTIAAIYNGNNVAVYSKHLRDKYELLGGEL